MPCVQLAVGTQQLNDSMNMSQPMNMPQPPRQMPYVLHNKALPTAAEETMTSAAQEIHDIKPEFEDGLAKCSLSRDGTWQRGFSSLNGCVTAISMAIGKVLDVKPLCKVCKKCREHENDVDTPENAAWRADHESQCKANCHGSSISTKHGTRGCLADLFPVYRETSALVADYFGDGDRKSFNLVKDQYNIYDIEVQKKECVGHVQKRLGTALRKLKKKRG